MRHQAHLHPLDAFWADFKVTARAGLVLLSLCLLSSWASTARAAAEPAMQGAASVGDATAAASVPRLRSPLQVQRGTGPVLARPAVQLVRLGSPPLADSLQQFLLDWRASKAWAAMTAEWGVGQLTVLAPRQASVPAGASMADVDDDSGETQDSALEDLVARLAETQPAEQSVQTVYVLLLPMGVRASPSSEIVDACAAHLWAWHSATLLDTGGNQRLVPYIVLPDCPGTGSMRELDRKTAALSHALVQAVTNPAAGAVAGVDAQHAAHELLAEEGELGTVCTLALHGSDSWLVRPDDMHFAVARVWSNSASLAGVAPCVPGASVAAAERGGVVGPLLESFFQADVALEDQVDAALAGGARVAHTPGVELMPGKTARVDVHWLGTDDAPFRVTATEMGSHDLRLQLDASPGKTGDVRPLTLRLRKEPRHGQQVVRLTAERDGRAYSNYFVVRQGRLVL